MLPTVVDIAGEAVCSCTMVRWFNQLPLELHQAAASQPAEAEAEAT